MYLASIFWFITVLLPPLIFILTWLLASRSKMDQEKLSPYECGFDPIHTSRVPFSLRFFLLAVIFLVFDIEIALILPLSPAALLLNPYIIISPSLLFLTIIFLGLLHEWREGSLDWS